MSLPDPIDTEAALDDCLSSATFLLFKHSFRCPISTRAFDEYRAYLEDGDLPPTGWIDVVEQRSLSQAVAQRTGVTHESPQALLIEDGKVVWHASHGAITRASLRHATKS